MSAVHLPSPLEKIDHPTAKDKSCHLYIKREDLIHPSYGGNKWRKLRYNVAAFHEGNFSHLVTFGGPFSNHIAATASICYAHKIPCVGIIRGTYHDTSNPTLLKALKENMDIRHIPKVAYAEKERSEVVQELLVTFPRPYLVPEGGSNKAALLGVDELNREINDAGIPFSHIVVASGTGTTAAGLIRTGGQAEIIAINVLENASLGEHISGLVGAEGRRWTINADYTFGGFAKVNQHLIDFIKAFKSAYGVPLDPIYNGKAMYATLDMMIKDYFPRGSNILYVHTGGLQGITSYNYTVKNKAMEIL